MLAYIDDEPGVILPSSVQRETYSLGATYGGRRGMPVLKPVILFLTTSTVTFEVNYSSNTKQCIDLLQGHVMKQFMKMSLESFRSIF